MFTPPWVVGLPIVFPGSWTWSCPPLKGGPVYFPWRGPHLMEIPPRTRRLPGLFAFILVAPDPGSDFLTRPAPVTWGLSFNLSFLFPLLFCAAGDFYAYILHPSLFWPVLFW